LRSHEKARARAIHRARIPRRGPQADRAGQSNDAEALLGAMKGISWESPRGPISIDPKTQRPRGETAKA